MKIDINRELFAMNGVLKKLKSESMAEDLVEKISRLAGYGKFFIYIMPDFLDKVTRLNDDYQKMVNNDFTQLKIKKALVEFEFKKDATFNT